MKKTRLFTFLVASIFALAISAQGIVVHQGNSKKVSFKSADVQKIEFTEDQVENSTDNYVEESELNKLRDEINRKLDRTEADKIWKEIERILGLCSKLSNDMVDKSAHESAVSSLRKDIEDKANRSDLDKALKRIDELSGLVKDLQSKIGTGSGSIDTNIHNGHAYVDLGLSVKWADMNVGADKPEDYGYYYAWGETEPKAVYTWNTYFDSTNGNSSYFKKYEKYKKTILDTEDDVAHVKWSGDWRMPTKAEQDELITLCTWIWRPKNGVNGYAVFGPNGNSIFLPAAGYRYDDELKYAGSKSQYWSSSLSSSYSRDAYYLGFYSKEVQGCDASRCSGCPVRPVCP